eukprot:TRINITY_DN13098_c0_g2_i1.p2 TRINITY_DN13098_c0_g2~~TRINITY_DN13098_c0_g2_i1.p2  ORF type:complete len:209 (+),score=35.40 TRINITY_DN13098_c0_g2_i1:149-775(+)
MSAGEQALPSDLINSVLVGTFACTVTCALLCAFLSRLHAARLARVVPHGAAGRSWPDSSLGAKEATATCPDEYFQVLRLSSTVFQVQPWLEGQSASPTKAAAEAACGEREGDDDLSPKVASSPGDVTPEACEICCEETARVVLVPCAHGGLCEACADQILRRSNRHCPHCRGHVELSLFVESPEMFRQGLPSRAKRRQEEMPATVGTT